MEAKINIHGDIGNSDGEVSLMSVIQQVKAQPEATSYLVSINSDGGEVDVGFDIYNYLRSLQLPIKTIAENSCCSIATVIFMSGDTRIVRENTMFMIHLPWGTAQGTAEEISIYSEVVKQAEDKLVKFYIEKTSNTKEAIVPLLKQETFMNIDQAITLGFATVVQKMVSAKAYFNQNSNKMQTQLSKEDKSWIETQFNKVLKIGKKADVKASMQMQDASGVTIEFTDLNEGDIPKLNDVATIDGLPAEGEYVMPDGGTFVFMAGALVENVSVKYPNEQMALLEAENAELKEQLGLANSNFAQLQTEIVNLKKGITSRFDVNAQREQQNRGDKENQPTNRKLLKD